MTAITLVGRVTDRDGLWRQGALSFDGSVARDDRSFGAFPAAEYRSTQPATIPVNVEHQGDAVGELVHIENLGGNLVAVATVSGCPWLLSNQRAPVYWSAEISYRGDGRDIELTGLAVVESPAVVGMPALTVHPGDVRELGSKVTAYRTPEQQLLKRAAATHQRRRYRSGEPIRIEGHTEADHFEPDEVRAIARPSGRMMLLPDGTTAEVEHRPATIVAVEGRPVGTR